MSISPWEPLAGIIPPERLFGRTVLTATPPKVLDANSIAKILQDVIPLHMENAYQINFLHWFYRGDQPILGRIKEVRPEINNKITENRAWEIVSFKLGYEFSHPILYTLASQRDAAPISLLNTFARLDGKDAKDQGIAEWMFVSGAGYRFTQGNPDEDEDSAPYFTDVLDPRKTFTVYSTEIGGKKLFSGYITRIRNANDEMQWSVSIYTDNHFYEWIVDNWNADYREGLIVRDEPLAIGNPIIEYPLNPSRMGYVELCYHLYNAVNTIDSNRIDDIEQIVQAIMVFLNCEPPEVNGEKVLPQNGGGGR